MSACHTPIARGEAILGLSVLVALGGVLSYLVWQKLFTAPPAVHNQPYRDGPRDRFVPQQAGQPAQAEPRTTVISAHSGQPDPVATDLPQPETDGVRTVGFDDWTPYPVGEWNDSPGGPPPTLEPLTEPEPIPNRNEWMPPALPNPVDDSARRAESVIMPMAWVGLFSPTLGMLYDEGDSDQTAPPAQPATATDQATPANTPTAGVGPVPADAIIYSVREGDHPYSISARAYGSGSYFRALAVYLRDHAPEAKSLQAGRTLVLPSVARLRSAYPELCPAQDDSRQVRADPPKEPAPRLYTIESGDTLLGIARRELGRSSRWIEIYELNRDRLEAQDAALVPGQRLRLPPAERGEQTATRAPRVRFQ